MSCPPGSKLIEIALRLRGGCVEPDLAFESSGEAALDGCDPETLAAYHHARRCHACRDGLLRELGAEMLHQEMATRGSRMSQGQPEPLSTFRLSRVREAEQPSRGTSPSGDPTVRGAAPAPMADRDPASTFVNGDGSLLARLIPRKSGGVLAAVLGLDPPPAGQVFALRTLGQEFRLDDDFTAVVPLVPAEEVVLTIRPAKFFSENPIDPD